MVKFSKGKSFNIILFLLIKVKPEVLCIGFKKKIKFSTFMFDCRKSKFIQVEDTAQITHPMTSVTGTANFVQFQVQDSN